MGSRTEKRIKAGKMNAQLKEGDQTNEERFVKAIKIPRRSRVTSKSYTG